VHEQLFHSVAKLGLHCFYTETTIHHTGYEDAELKKKKALRNLLLLEEDPERVSREPSLAMAMGDSYYILGDYQKGIEAYRRTMEMPNCREINRDIYNELPSCIGRGYQKLGRREEALPWFDKTIALTPEKHEAYYYKAECLMELNRPAEAEPIYAKLAEMPVSYSTTSNQYDVVQIYSHYHLALFLHDRSDYAGALKRLDILNAKYPQVVEGWQLLGKCQLSMGDGEAAIQSWTKAINLNPPPFRNCMPSAWPCSSASAARGNSMRIWPRRAASSRRSASPLGRNCPPPRCPRTRRYPQAPRPRASVPP